MCGSLASSTSLGEPGLRLEIDRSTAKGPRATTSRFTASGGDREFESPIESATVRVERGLGVECRRAGEVLICVVQERDE